MGDTSKAVTSAQKRSWSGCTRCKKRRQKCDELRPSCTRCQTVNTECVYEIKLRWGGRSFSQSRFGACMTGSTNTVKKQGNAGSFIYVSNTEPTPQRRPELLNLPIVDNSQAVDRKSISTRPNAVNLPRFSSTIDPFCNFSELDRLLLDHFINSTSHIISCHPIVREDICRAIVPVALENPTLFYATMALSAIHQKSQAGMKSMAIRRDPLVIHLLSNSLSRLHDGLLQRDVTKSSVLLATIRTLFLCEVHSGGDRPGTWRAHFEGAKALMHNIEAWKGYSAKERTSTAYFLKRWYTMTESFVALTSDGLATGQLARLDTHTLDDNDEGTVYLDEYAGFTTDLSSMFCEIGAAAWERRRAYSSNGRRTILFETDLDEEAMHLAQSIWDRIERNQAAPPAFRPGLEDKLSDRQKRDFLLCNDAWHYMGLIYIHRQISGHHTASPPVQLCVKKILECTESISATAGLTPLVVLTTPLFAAGCEALGEDRKRVRALLRQMFQLLRIPNIHRSLEILESFWTSPVDIQDWDSFMKAQHWDFLPY